MPPESFPGLFVAPLNPRGTLLYDGGCGFCERSVVALHRISRIPLHAIPASEMLDLLPAGVRHSANDQVLWLAPDGSLTGGIAAIANALRAGGRAGLALALMLPVVRQTARATYRLVARFRHRLPGSGGACPR